VKEHVTFDLGCFTTDTSEIYKWTRKEWNSFQATNSKRT